MANSLFQCNTSNVDEMRHGRPQTVLNDAERPNGVIVTLGGTLEAQEGLGREYDHCHAITEGALTAVVGAYVVVAPEIMEDEYRTINGQIGKFALKADETYSAYRLQKHDRLEYSEAYFDGADELEVGDKVNVQAAGDSGERFVASETGCLRVVSIANLWMPVMLKANSKEGALMPASVKMIKVEVEK